MSDTWESYSLEDVCEFIDRRGVTPKKLGSDFLSTGYRVISAKNIKRRRIDLNAGEQRFVDEETYRKWMNSPLRADDVLLTSEAPLGEPAYISEDLEWCLGQRLFGIQTVKSKLYGRFLYFALQSDIVRSDLLSRATGATAQGIRQSELRKVSVSIPSLPEQRRIVGILDEAFDGIAAAKANAEKNLRNARELFSACFGAVASEKKQRDWRTTIVAELAESKKGSIRTGPFGSQLLHSEFVDEGIAVLGIDNAVANKFRWGKRRFITPRKYADLKRYRVYPGDVIISIMGTCGRCAIVPEDIPEAINTKHLCCITLDQKKCEPGYLHAYFLYHPIAQEFLAKHAKGAIMAGLNMGIIKDLPVLLPPLDRQKEIVSILRSLRTECERLELNYQRKLAALDELRQSVLHQAFSGML